MSCEKVFFDPKIYTENELPGKPTDLKIVENPPLRNSSNVQVSIAWNMPQSMSQTALVGYLLTVETLGQTTKQQHCVYFNTTNLDKNIQYSCLPNLEFQKSYYLKVYSIPLSKDSEGNFIDLYFTTSGNYETQIKPETWQTFVAFKVFNVNSGATIMATFHLAPEMYNFTEYSIGLVDHAGISQIKQTKTVSVSQRQETMFLENICAGKYKITVHPSWKKGYGICQYCTSSETEFFNVSSSCKNNVQRFHKILERREGRNNLIIPVTFTVAISMLAMGVAVIFCILKRSISQRNQTLIEPPGNLDDDLDNIHICEEFIKHTNQTASIMYPQGTNETLTQQTESAVLASLHDNDNFEYIQKTNTAVANSDNIYT